MICSLLALRTLGQKPIKSISVNEKIVFATVDRPGDLYLLLNNGHIQKFDVEGNLAGAYKGAMHPTLFDARDGSRLFAYFRNGQEYAYLSPSFELTARHSLDPSWAINPWLVCASGDHNIWILDAADKTIKRINTTTSGIEVEIVLADVSDESPLTYMREYQGFLFLLDANNGIRIFSSMGKPLKMVGPAGLKAFNFFGEELYYLLNGKLMLFNLFTAQTRTIPVPKKEGFMLMTDTRLFSADGMKADIFTFAQ
jgi:hypothetical protein